MGHARLGDLADCRIAQGESNKVWIIPSEFVQAMSSLGSAIKGVDGEERS